jgi:hypothetical protein
MSGFNVLLNKQDLVDYMKRFTAERDLLIAKVEVEDLRPKPTNPLVMLAGRMKIVEVYRNN